MAKRRFDLVMLAVKPETRERIKRDAAQLVEWIRENPEQAAHLPEARENANPGFVGMSMDDMVNLLLDDRDRHRGRRKRSRRVTRRRAAGEGQGDSGLPEYPDRGIVPLVNGWLCSCDEPDFDDRGRCRRCAPVGDSV
jgi:hypothetical protein